MSKKSLDVLGLINKGVELYEQCGDTIKDAAKQLGFADESGKDKRSKKGEQAKSEGLMGLINKGKAFYEQHGETIMGIAQQVGVAQKLGFSADAEAETKTAVEEADVVAETKTEVVEKPESVVVAETKTEVAEVVAPKTEEVEVVEKPAAQVTIKDLRREVKEDKSFEESVSVLQDSATSALFDISDPTAVMHAINTLGNVAQETIKYAEEQETKREEIRAMRDVSIARINALKESVQLYLEKSFDERKDLFNKQFECVNKALESGNVEMLAVSLSAINELAASSPFKSLADVASVQKSLTANAEWDI